MDPDDEKQKKIAKRIHHGYFEGYSEIITLKDNGKGASRQWIYTGDVFLNALSGKQKIILRSVYLLALLLSTGFFLYNGLLLTQRNEMWYVTLPQAVSIPFLFWAYVAWFRYLPMREKLTKKQYTYSSLHIKIASCGTAACFGCIAISILLYLFLHPASFGISHLAAIAEYLISGGAMLVIYLKESKVFYAKIPGSAPQ